MRRLLAVLAVLSSAACAAAPRAATTELAAYAPATPAPPPAPLDRSLFAPVGSSRLTEADIARLLDAPIELRYPARVGVVALGTPFEPGAPSTLEEGVAAAKALTASLEDTGLVAVASEVSRELPTGGGVEGLRELAARYRAPYLVLYTERFEDRSHGNGWSVLWATVVGGLVTPNRTVEGQGVLEASVLDVRTGTLLFTVQETVSFEETRLPLRAEGGWRDLRRAAADEGAKQLAKRVVEKWQRTARLDQERREEAEKRAAETEPPPTSATETALPVVGA